MIVGPRDEYLIKDSHPCVNALQDMRRGTAHVLAVPGWRYEPAHF
jgi:hypothetical protein